MADILTNSTVVNLDISIWTGKAQLKRTEVDDSALPPKELATLGSKRLFDPEKLKKFGGIKSSAHALCGKYGVKFIGGWLVDNQYLQELVGKLAQYRDRWDDVLRTFLAEYQQNCQEWLIQNSQWAKILVNAMPRESEIAKRFNFGWQVFNIVPAPTGVNGDQTDAELGCVPTRAMERVAEEIAGILPCYEPGKRRMMEPLRKVQRMCKTMSFSSPEMARLEEVLGKLDALGDTSIIRLVLGMLTDAKTIMKMCEPSQTATDILDGIVGQQQPPAPEPEPVQEPIPASVQTPQDRPLPDVSSLIQQAFDILNPKPVQQVAPAPVPEPEPENDPVGGDQGGSKQPEPIPVAGPEPTPTPQPEHGPVVDANAQAVSSMLGMIDSGGLW